MLFVKSESCILVNNIISNKYIQLAIIQLIQGQIALRILINCSFKEF